MRRNELINRTRQFLLNRREVLRRALNEVCATTLSVDDCDVRDIGDAAIETEYREVVAELAEVESRELKQIGEALQRLSDGTYGVCMSCDRSIPMARLQALPYATKCVQCQQQADPPTRAHPPMTARNSVTDSIPPMTLESATDEVPLNLVSVSVVA